MACGMAGTKPLLGPMLNHCQLNSSEKMPVVSGLNVLIDYEPFEADFTQFYAVEESAVREANQGSSPVKSGSSSSTRVIHVIFIHP